MNKIDTSIIINASPEKVWDTLINFKDYPEWNPFIPQISGDLEVGSSLSVTIKPPNGKGVTLRPKILTLTSNKELRWLGKPGGIPFIASGEHHFIIEKISENQIKFIHGENFSGILVPFMNSVWKDAENGFLLMNKSLKARVEADKKVT